MTKYIWTILILPVAIGFPGCSNGDGDKDTDSNDMTSNDARTLAVAEHPSAIIANPDDEANWLFDQNVVRTYDILISEENLAYLDNDPSKEEYVEGSIVIDGKTHDPVGIRYKGGNGSWVLCLEGFEEDLDETQFGGVKECYKLPLKIKFNWNDPEGRFLGVRKLQFHAMLMDYSILRERLGYSIYRDMGVVAPRSAHARLLINGEYHGLFLLVEQIDGRYTRSRFKEGGEGNLYKEAWPQWDDSEKYMLGLRTNEDENPSVDRMLALTAELKQASQNGTEHEVIARWFDINHTMRHIVTEWGIGDDDGTYNWVCGHCELPNDRDTCLPPDELELIHCTNHNYYFYEEVEADRLWLLPWDLDVAFRGGDWGFEPLVTAWDQERLCEVDLSFPYFGRMAPNCNPLLKGLMHFEPEYVAVMQELLDGPFKEEAIAAKLDAWIEQLRPYVQEQNDVWGNDSKPTMAGWDIATGVLRKKIENLRNINTADIAARKKQLGI